MHSKKLAEHFESNPKDLDALKHDKPLATLRKQPHLENVPSYLKPATEGATGTVAAVTSRRRGRPEGKGRSAGLASGGAKKRVDPLRTFRAGKKGVVKGRR